MSKKTRRARLKDRRINVNSVPAERSYPLVSTAITKDVPLARLDMGQLQNKYHYLYSDLKSIAIIAGALMLILAVLPFFI